MIIYWSEFMEKGIEKDLLFERNKRISKHIEFCIYCLDLVSLLSLSCLLCKSGICHRPRNLFKKCGWRYVQHIRRKVGTVLFTPNCYYRNWKETVFITCKMKRIVSFALQKGFSDFSTCHCNSKFLRTWFIFSSRSWESNRIVWIFSAIGVLKLRIFSFISFIISSAFLFFSSSSAISLRLYCDNKIWSLLSPTVPYRVPSQDVSLTHLHQAIASLRLWDVRNLPVISLRNLYHIPTLSVLLLHIIKLQLDSPRSRYFSR